MPNITDFNNITILQTAFIGDVALSLHLAEVIKKLHPSSHITYVTTPQAEQLAKCAKAINKVIAFDKRRTHKGLKGIRHITNQLQASGTDCIISPHRSLRSSLITLLSRPKISVGFNKNALHFIFKHRVRYDKYIHETQRNINLLSIFDDVNVEDIHSTSAEIEIPDKDIIYTDKLLHEKLIDHSPPLIAVAPGSVWETKKWGTDNFIELCRSLKHKHYHVILIGSKADADLCNSIADQTDSVSLAGLTSLPQTLCILQKADLTVTNDSAPCHLSELAGTPVVSIFGPTVPEFGFAPRMELSSVMQIPDMDCRPCAIHGSKQCPIGTHDCMQKIDYIMVLNAVEEILSAIR